MLLPTPVISQRPDQCQVDELLYYRARSTNRHHQPVKCLSLARINFSNMQPFGLKENFNAPFPVIFRISQ